MKLINSNTVLLKEKEWKAPKAKKGDETPLPESNPEVIGEATVIQSLDERLKKGDKVMINRTGILDTPIGKNKYVLIDIEDCLIKL